MTEIETHVLQPDERDLLLWLNEDSFSQYGECYGRALDRLCALGLAQVHQPGEHQNSFIAQDHTGSKGIMYRAVSLTDAGLQLATEIKAAAVQKPSPPIL